MFLKKFATIFATIFLISSCNMSSVNNTVPELQSNSKLKGFSIKSTTNPNEVKKSFLPLTRITKIRKKDDDEKKTKVFNFIATKDDLKRSFLLNIINGAGGLSRVGNIEVSINGSPIIWGHDEELNETDDINKIKKELCHDLEHDNDKDDKNKTKNKPSCKVLLNNFFNRKTTSTSIPLRDLKEGVNILEIKVKDERNNYALDISIDGFLRSIDIPNAIFSKIPYTPTIRTQKHQKGNVGIKFLEGMKVRLINNTDGTQKLVDLNGTSLTMLENTLKRLKANLIYRPVSVEPDESDQDEIKAEALLQKDVPNRNLFYNLSFDKTLDVWAIVDELRKIPFLEEAFPLFILPLNSEPFTTEPELAGIIPNDLDTNELVLDAYGRHIGKGDWLKKIHVASHDGKLGAWDITTGNNSIKVATLDTAAQLKSNLPDAENHEDFTDTNGNLASNFEPYYNYKEPRADVSDPHGTQVASVVASVPNGKGIAGVAYGCKIMPININMATSTGDASDYESLCLGSKDSNGNITKPCDSIADSIILARKKGAKVISISLGGAEYGLTLEKYSPILTTEIINAIANGVVVVISAGNDSYNYGDITREAIDGYGFDYYNNNQNLNSEKYFPTPDTGSIIAGGLNWEGNSLATSSIGNRFNFGISPNGANVGLAGYTYFDTNGNEHGHGTDVSGPAFHIWVAHQPTPKENLYNVNKRIYDEFGGTSAVAPMTAATAAIILSVNPNLSPLEVRKIIRDTRHDELITNPENTTWGAYPIAGMLDSYEAVYKALCLNPNESERCGNIVNGVFKSIKNSAGVDVPVVTNGSKIEVKAGDQIAIPITPSIKNQLSNVYIGGIQLNLLQIVQNYAIYGIPNLGTSSFTATTNLIDIVIKNNLGQTVETLADALKILLDAITQTKGFPSSITVNGVTTNLDYGFNFDFNELSGNTVFDKSGNNNNATLGCFNGTLPERFSLADGSTGLRFTNEAYLRVPDNNSYEMPNSFTFLSKIKINEINKYQTLLIKGSGVSGLLDSYTWSIDEQNRITLSMLKAGNTNPCTLFTQSVPLYLVTNPLNIQPNETIGLAVSFDQVNKVLKFYKNQTELSYTVAYPIPNSICGNVYDYNRLPDSPLDLFIGSYVYDNGTLHYPDSNLQELYLIANVKNRALNGSEVGKIFYDMGLRN